MRSRTSQARRVTYSGDIAERVRHLENLVLSLGARNSGLQNQSADSATIRVVVPDNDGGLSQEIGTPGTMHGDQMGTRWFDDTHWQAIMDDVSTCGGLLSATKLIRPKIAELKGCTDTQSRGEPLLDTVEEDNYGLTLFFGLSPSINRSDLLAFLPSRPVADRLVSRYFNTKEPILSM